MMDMKMMMKRLKLENVNFVVKDMKHVSVEDKMVRGFMPLSYRWIANIEKLLEKLSDEIDFQRESLRNEQYAQGIEYCIQKLKEIIEST